MLGNRRPHFFELIDLDIARNYFGFEESSGFRFVTIDGLVYINSLENKIYNPSEISSEIIGSFLWEKLNATTLLDVLFVDVDCKDATSGTTAPPIEFIAEPSLRSMHHLLDDQGLLVVNVASRVDAFIKHMIERMTQIFAQVYKIQASEEDLNIIVVGVKHSSTLDMDQREALLNKWLKVFHLLYILRNYCLL